MPRLGLCIQWWLDNNHPGRSQNNDSVMTIAPGSGKGLQRKNG